MALYRLLYRCFEWAINPPIVCFLRHSQDPCCGKLQVILQGLEGFFSNQNRRSFSFATLAYTISGTPFVDLHASFFLLISTLTLILVLNRKLEISFIYDISKHDKYIAYNNKIFVNGIKKTFYRKILNKKSSILVTGFPHKYNFKKKLVNFKKYNKIRMIGCASLSMLGCMQGNFDWYQEKNIMLWDVAAGYHFNILNNCIVHKFDKNKIIQEVSLGYCK